MRHQKQQTVTIYWPSWIKTRGTELLLRNKVRRTEVHTRLLLTGKSVASELMQSTDAVTSRQQNNR
jgi:hypothetical protein